jgi:hypothetical protein
MVIVMSEAQSEHLHSFQAFLRQAEEGAEIPAVPEQDLKCLHEMCVERAKRYCGKDGVLSIDSMVRACAPGTNLPAAWLRHTQLRRLYREGLLSQWQHGIALDDIVFHLAATIPMTGTTFDHSAFLRGLHQDGKTRTAAGAGNQTDDQ